jgi:hypothetical protein
MKRAYSTTTSNDNNKGNHETPPQTYNTGAPPIRSTTAAADNNQITHSADTVSTTSSGASQPKAAGPGLLYNATPPNTNRPNSANQHNVADRSMGVWYFDKKTKTRRYRALTGRVYTGFEGMQHADADKKSLDRPTSARKELEANMTALTRERLVTSGLFHPSKLA